MLRVDKRFSVTGNQTLVSVPPLCLDVEDPSGPSGAPIRETADHSKDYVLVFFQNLDSEMFFVQLVFPRLLKSQFRAYFEENAFHLLDVGNKYINAGLSPALFFFCAIKGNYILKVNPRPLALWYLEFLELS